MTTPSLLFLSGAGLPEWIWDETRAALPAAGVVAPRPSPTRPSIRDGGVMAYAEAALSAAPSGPLTVVAHSAGGIIAAALTALAPQRIHGVLGVTAVIPSAGHSFVSSMPYPNRLVLPFILKIAGTRPPEGAIRTRLAAGVNEEVADRLIQDFTPEPHSYFTSRVASELVAPMRGYLTSDDDLELPVALQSRYSAKLRPTFVRSLTGGHLPMLRQPNQLAAAITDFQNAFP